MQVAINQWRKMSHGNRTFYAAVCLCGLLCIFSVATESFFLSEFISQFTTLHAVNALNWSYLEMLFWSLGITIAQLYMYYTNTMDMYDVMNIKGVAGFRASLSRTLQFLLSVLTFYALLIIFIAIFVEYFRWGIQEDYGVRIDALLLDYLPWTDLTLLIWLFLAMDLVILGLNKNFCATRNCSEEAKIDFSKAASELRLDIPVALLAAVGEMLVVKLLSFYSNHGAYENSFGVGLPEFATVLIIFFLQAYYVIATITRRLSEPDIPLTSGQAI